MKPFLKLCYITEHQQLVVGLLTYRTSIADRSVSTNNNIYRCESCLGIFGLPDKLTLAISRLNLSV